jgi:hypothetical protein
VHRGAFFEMNRVEPSADLRAYVHALQGPQRTDAAYGLRERHRRHGRHLHGDSRPRTGRLVLLFTKASDGDKSDGADNGKRQ